MLFADDTKACCDHSSLRELENSELNGLVDWFSITKLSINTTKSCVIISHQLIKTGIHPFNLQLKWTPFRIKLYM